MSFCSMAPLTPLSVPGGPGGVLCAAASNPPMNPPHTASVTMIVIALPCLMRRSHSRLYLISEDHAPPRGNARSRVSLPRNRLHRDVGCRIDHQDTIRLINV